MRLADLIKASFGGDRSAAGRYAAEQRWKDHVKKQPEGGSPSGGQDVLRLMGGTPQTFTVKGVIQVEGFDRTEEISAEDEAKYAGVVMRTTVKEFRKLINDGSLDLSDRYKEHYLRILENEEYANGNTRIGVYLTVDAIPVRNQNIQPVRPDQPHLPMDVRAISLHNSTAAVLEDQGLYNETEQQLTLNTSPKNQGPAKAATLRRWEKAWASDYDPNDPYCAEIARHAAHQMGEIKTPPPVRDIPSGFKTPSQETLAQDATNILQSIHEGVAGQPVLWRGFDGTTRTKAAVRKAKEGDTFIIGLGATSRDMLMAVRYSSEEPRTILRIEEGSKGVDIARGQAVYVHDQEVITSGRFAVTSVETVKVPSWMLEYGTPFGSPTQVVGAQRQAIDKLRSMLKPAQITKLETLVTKRETKARVEERQETSIRVISVTQVATFNPETEEFEENE